MNLNKEQTKPHECHYKAKVTEGDFFYFGVSKGVLPVGLLDRLEKRKIEYFDLTTSVPITDKVAYVSREEAYALATFFTNFNTSPLAIYYRKVIDELVRRFYDEPEVEQIKIIKQYFGLLQIDLFSRSKYDTLEEYFEALLFDAVVPETPFVIMRERYNLNIFDLDFESVNDYAWATGRAKKVSGILSFMTEDGETIRIALRNKRDSTLALNRSHFWATASISVESVDMDGNTIKEEAR